MQVLHELAQRVLVALCFASNLAVVSVSCDVQYASSIGRAYTAITLVLHVSSQFQAPGFLGCERAEADALHLAGDFELDL